MALSEKQLRFVDEFVKTNNASKAARAAGYSSKNADVVGPRLLVNVGIKQEIDARVQAIRDKAGVTAEKVVAALWNIAKIDVRNVFNADGTLKDVHEMPEELTSAIASIEVDEDDPGVKKIKFWNKTEALGMLGKHLRLFVDVKEHSGPQGGPIPMSTQPIDFSGFTTEQLKVITGLSNGHQ